MHFAFYLIFIRKIQRTKMKHVCRLWTPRKYWMWKYAEGVERWECSFFVWVGVWVASHCARGSWVLDVCERLRIKRCMYFR
jgi:hypothetical protein